MIEIATGLLADCLTAKGVAVSGVVSGAVGSAIAKIITKRHETLKEILLSEIRQGSLENVNKDELISIYFRLIRDAEEGVARNNLRLMARVIDGMAEKNQLQAPTFLKYANILSDLTEEEITVLGFMVADKKLNTGRDLSYSQLLLKGTAPRQKMEKKYGERAQNIQQALVRTGLISMSIISKTHEDKNPDKPMYGAEEKEVESKINYSLTPLMAEIEKYINNFEMEDL